MVFRFPNLNGFLSPSRGTILSFDFFRALLFPDRFVTLCTEKVN